MTDLEYYIDKTRARCPQCGEFEPIKYIHEGVCRHKYKKISAIRSAYVNKTPLWFLPIFILISGISAGVYGLELFTGKLTGATYLIVLFVYVVLVSVVVLKLVLESADAIQRPRIERFNLEHPQFIEMEEAVKRINVSTAAN